MQSLYYTSNFLNFYLLVYIYYATYLLKEYLNCTAKTALGVGGLANLRSKSVNRIGKCVRLFQNAQHQFDTVTDVRSSIVSVSAGTG